MRQDHVVKSKEQTLILKKGPQCPRHDSQQRRKFEDMESAKEEAAAISRKGWRNMAHSKEGMEELSQKEKTMR